MKVSGSPFIPRGPGVQDQPKDQHATFEAIVGMALAEVK